MKKTGGKKKKKKFFLKKTSPTLKLWFIRRHSSKKIKKALTAQSTAWQVGWVLKVT